MQQFLYFLPLPQGQGSLLPILRAPRAGALGWGAPPPDVMVGVATSLRSTRRAGATGGWADALLGFPGASGSAGDGRRVSGAGAEGRFGVPAGLGRLFSRTGFTFFLRAFSPFFWATAKV